MAEEPVRCPICNTNLLFYSSMQRELHGDACLQKLECPESSSSECVVELPSARFPDGKREEVGENDAIPEPEEFAATTETQEESTTESCQEVEETIGTVRDVEVDGETVNEPELEKVVVKVEQKTVKSLKRHVTKQEAMGEPPQKRRMPFYKVLNFGANKFAVDAFSYGAIEGVSAYFLSHFHSDHYGGLSKGWKHGPIYCSPATARLVAMQLRVDPAYLREVPVGVPTQIEGVEVVFLDANHCPGAVVILYDRHTLHTGDFRASSALLESVKQFTTRLKTVYLDTTYLDPLRRFPNQSQVVRVCADYCASLQKKPTSKSFFTAQRPRRILVMVGTYTIGKERIAVAIAKALKTKVFANARKKKILEALGDSELDELLEPDGLKCQVHLTPMGSLSIAKLEDQWRFLKKHYTDLIAFVPTGWTWPTKNKIDPASFDAGIMTAAATNRPQMQICRVPYSEHSSYTELENFCRGIPIGRLIATVGTANLEILKTWESPDM